MDRYAHTPTNRPLAAIFAAALVLWLVAAGCGEDPEIARPKSVTPSAPNAAPAKIASESFYDVYGPFRPELNVDSITKKQKFDAYRGKMVQWSGPMGAARLMRGGMIEAEFLHQRNGHTVVAKTVVDFDKGQGDDLLKTAPGQLVDYRGRLVRYTDKDGVTVFYLAGGKLIRIGDAYY